MEIAVFNANNVDPDQIPHSTFDLGLYYLPLTPFWGL